jgi:hypothetical protein
MAFKSLAQSAMPVCHQYQLKVSIGAASPVTALWLSQTAVGRRHAHCLQEFGALN